MHWCNHIRLFSVIKLANFPLICTACRCDKGVVDFLPRLREHTPPACRGKRHWPVLNEAAAFACLPPIVLVCVCCVLYPVFLSTFPSSHSHMGICGTFVCIFICPHDCFCVWVYAHLVGQLSAWGKRRGGCAVWCAGTSKPLWLADWLAGLSADWKSLEGQADLRFDYQPNNVSFVFVNVNSARDSIRQVIISAQSDGQTPVERCRTSRGVKMAGFVQSSRQLYVSFPTGDGPMCWGMLMQI